MSTARKYLTTAEAADELRVSRNTVRRWIKAGKLPALRVGSTDYRIDRGDWDALMATMRVSQPLTRPAP